MQVWCRIGADKQDVAFPKGCAWSHEPSQLPNGACGRILGIFKKHGSGEHSAHECPLRLNMLKGKNLGAVAASVQCETETETAKPEFLQDTRLLPAEMFSACIALSN